MSRLYLEQFGKGPLRAVTFVNDDVVTTVMHDVFTVAERALAANGRADSVLSVRMLWQRETDEAFKAAVGVATGRRVLTAVSGFELDDDVAIEVFLLAPR